MKKLLLILISLILYTNVFCNDKGNTMSFKYNFKQNNIEEDSILNTYGYKILSLPNSDSYKPKIALILSGGGARGVSQVGAIEVLEQAGIKFNYVVGTSIGSIIGGLYSIGYSSYELDSIIKGTDWNDVFSLKETQKRRDLFLDQKIIDDRRLLTLRFKDYKFIVPDGMSFGTKFNTFLQNIIWNGIYKDNENFNYLKFPFRAVTTDINKGTTISLSKGSLVTAIRASSSFPIRYSPVRIDSMILVDGGLMANIPVEQADEFKPDIKIVISTVSPLYKHEDLNNPINIADQIVSVMIEKFSKNSLGLADVVITPELKDHSNTDFSGFEMLIQKGKDASLTKISQIKNLIKLKEDSIFKYKYIDKNKLFNTQYKKVNLIGFLANDSNFIMSSIKNNDLFDVINIIRAIDTNNVYYAISFFNLNDKRNNDSGSKILEGDMVLNIVAKTYPQLKSVSIVNPIIKNSQIFLSSLNNKYKTQYLSPYLSQKISEDVLKYYREQNYSFANIDTMIYSYDNGELKIKIKNGIISSIKIVGNKSFSDYLVLRELDFKKGDVINSSKIVHGWQNLMSCGLFEDSVIEPIDNDSTGIDIIIKVKEIGTQTISIGTRVDDERYAQIGIDLISENLLNLGTRLNIRFVGGTRNQSTFINLETPRIWETMFTFNMKAYYNSRNVFNYVRNTNVSKNDFVEDVSGKIIENQFGFMASAGSQIEKMGILNISMRYERQQNYTEGNKKYSNDSSNIRSPYYSIANLKIGLTYDSKDKANFPTRGSVIDMFLETPYLNVKSSVNFSKIYFKYTTNLSFSESCLSPTIIFGFADASLPLPETFSLGGQDVFFGMREDQERGRQISLAQLEYRWHSPISLLFDTYISARYDLGSVWEQTEKINLSELKHGVGMTIGLDTPVGPAKFSLGKCFYFVRDPNAIIWGDVAVYFSIGMKL